MRNKFFVVLAISSMLFVFLLSCSKDSTSPQTPGEFVADAQAFVDFANWTMVEYTVAPNPILGGAHMGNNPEYARIVYISKQKSGSSYPQGTLVIKETFRWVSGQKEYAASGGLLGMAKRGGDFNQNNGGWEYFILNPADKSIVARGDTLMGGACQGCHSAAQGNNGTDFVFNHPAEYVAELADFIDYANWARIDSAFGPDPLLSTAHGIPDSLSRLVYLKQNNLQPISGRYPTGAIFLKELKNDVGQTVSGLTMMVKRGGSYNSAGNGWEWFMTNVTLDTVVTRGDNVTALNGMCAGCHAGANTGGNGQDWVFNHP